MYYINYDLEDKLKTTKSLTALGRNASEHVKDQASSIMNLYGDGKLTQIQTAEPVILKLVSRDGGVQTSGNKNNMID